MYTNNNSTNNEIKQKGVYFSKFIFVLYVSRKNMNIDNSNTNDKIKQKGVHFSKIIFVPYISRKNININNSNTNNEIEYDIEDIQSFIIN